MGLFDALNVSATGLAAERTRMDVTAENLANAQSTDGFRRKDVVLRQAGAGFAGALSTALGTARAGAGAPPPQPTLPAVRRALAARPRRVTLRRPGCHAHLTYEPRAPAPV